MFQRTVLRSFRPIFRAAQRTVHTASQTSRRTGTSALLGASAFAIGAAALGASPLLCSSNGKIDAVKKDILAAIEAEVPYANANSNTPHTNPLYLRLKDERRSDGTSICGTLVRLAWHQSGTYSAIDKTGGSNGACMRFAPEANWGCNAGLKVARDFLEPIKKKHPDMSNADIWTLAGATAIEAMGGPEIKWRPGRTDSSVGTTVPDGRLPNADNGGFKKDVAHIKDIFYRMGFDDREIVALIGAHAVGRCHTTASGYWGPWTFSEAAFSNQYFVLLLSEKWTLKTTHNGKV